MNQEIIDAIQKSLPAMQMDALKSELAKAASVPELQAKIIRTEEQLKKKEQELNDERVKRFDADSRAKKTDELAEQERNLKVKELEIKLSCEMVISSAIKEMAMAAFRNPTIHKSFMTPVAHNTQQSSWIEDRAGSETTTVT